MISWVNYHSHTYYCDGVSAPEDYVKEAIRLKLPAYGYSSHAPVPFPSDWNMPDNKLADYLSDIRKIKEQYQSQLQVYLALEIDYIPGIAGRSNYIMKGVDLDYFIGSIHYINQFPSGEYWNIDTTLELFEKGLKEIFSNDFRKAATRFWEVTRQMIEEDRPNIIGHLDKIKMFSANANYFNEDESWYRDQVDLTLKDIKKYGCIVEVNTRGYYRYGQPELYPGKRIIKRLVEYNIPIMISSDAHTPEEIIKGFPDTTILLKKLGVNKLAALYNNKWNEYPFTDKGLEIE